MDYTLETGHHSPLSVCSYLFIFFSDHASSINCSFSPLTYKHTSILKGQIIDGDRGIPPVADQRASVLIRVLMNMKSPGRVIR